MALLRLHPRRTLFAWMVFWCEVMSFLVQLHSTLEWI
jgi:hypothetical protein